MAADPIKIELSAFEKLQILRTEMDERTEEKEKLEGVIKSLLFEIEQASYLKSINPAYEKIDTSEREEKLKTLESRRTELESILDSLNKTLPEVEAMARGKKPAPSHSSGDKKFTSFDDFKKKFPNAL